MVNTPHSSSLSNLNNSIFFRRGYHFSSIGNLGDLAVGSSTLSDIFYRSLVEINTESLEDSLCEVCGKLTSGNDISISETWTEYDTGPVRSITVPGIHFAPSLRLLTNTLPDCPISNFQNLYYEHYGNVCDQLAFSELSSIWMDATSPVLCAMGIS